MSSRPRKVALKTPRFIGEHLKSTGEDRQGEKPHSALAFEGDTKPTPLILSAGPGDQKSAPCSMTRKLKTSAVRPTCSQERLQHPGSLGELVLGDYWLCSPEECHNDAPVKLNTPSPGLWETRGGERNGDQDPKILHGD